MFYALHRPFVISLDNPDLILFYSGLHLKAKTSNYQAGYPTTDLYSILEHERLPESKLIHMTELIILLWAFQVKKKINL